MTHLKNLCLLLALLLSLGACNDSIHDDDPKEEDDGSVNFKMNTFLEETFKSDYYWIDSITIPKSRKQEPEKYFDQITYIHDSWSFLRDESAYEEGDELTSLEDGNTYGLGFMPTIWQDSRKRILGAKVNYVYPNSPAAKQGLRRGDLITEIDGEEINDSNWLKLIGNEKTTFHVYPKMNEDKAKDITISPAPFDINPIMKDTILINGNKKIGYLCYTSFVYKNPGAGKKPMESEPLKELTRVFTKFKEGNIDELIIDLRFNGGGYSVAATHIASMLIPSSHTNKEEIWMYTKSRPDHKSNDGSMRLTKGLSGSLDNFPRVFFLMNKSTASASEMLISGVKPFVNEVITIGDVTAGKYAGGIVYTPEDDDIKKWDAYLITMSYTNKEGESVKGGIAPTYGQEITDQSGNVITVGYKGSDYYEETCELGEPEDTFISFAFDIINGTVKKRTRSTSSPTDPQPTPITLPSSGRLIMEQP